MKALIVTAGHRQYGQAIRSHLDAQSNMPYVYDWVYIHDDGEYSDPKDIVLYKYTRARETFLTGDYDLMISIEDDIILPPDAFTRLQSVLDNGADVAYGLTCWRNSHGGGWSAYHTIEGDHGWSILTDIPNAKKLFTEGAVIDVIGIGLYCTAIKRDVLERIPFRREPKHNNDWYFCQDMQSAGIVQRCDLGLICGHMTMFPTPRILYPSIENDLLQRIEYL